MGCGPSSVTNKALDGAQPGPRTPNPPLQSPKPKPTSPNYNTTQILPLESKEDSPAPYPSPPLLTLPYTPRSKKPPLSIASPPDKPRTNADSTSPKNATKSKNKNYSFHLQKPTIIFSKNRQAENGPIDSPMRPKKLLCEPFCIPEIADDESSGRDSKNLLDFEQCGNSSMQLSGSDDNKMLIDAKLFWKEYALELKKIQEKKKEIFLNGGSKGVSDYKLLSEDQKSIGRSLIKSNRLNKE
jgi:hypothetical protein